MKNERTFDGKKWHNRPIASSKRLLRVMTSNHHGDFYCLNCLYCSYSTKDSLKEHEEKCNNHDYWYPIMPKKYYNILKYNHGEKSLKAPFVIELGKKRNDTAN